MREVVRPESVVSHTEVYMQSRVNEISPQCLVLVSSNRESLHSEVITVIVSAVIKYILLELNILLEIKTLKYIFSQVEVQEKGIEWVQISGSRSLFIQLTTYTVCTWCVILLEDCVLCVKHIN